MRYRKSIKICKGVKLNLSKSGVSMTTGVRGLSFTSGSNGTYVNAGIPGSGLSTRKKIDGGSSAGRTVSTLRVRMDENGIISLYDESGAEVTDASIINQIKRKPEFKREKERLDSIRKEKNAAYVESYNKSVDELIHIINKSETVLSAADIQALLQSLKPEVYVKQLFKRRPPDKEGIRIRLEAESRSNVSSLAFWSVKKRRKQYVSERLEAQYAEAYSNWEAEKNAFDNKESAIASEKEKENLEIYERRCLRLKEFLLGDPSFIEQEIDSWLSEIEMPLDFSVQYDYNSECRCLYIDLDLPEIEDLPDEIATQLANGNCKIKKKTQASIREDYAQCVFGFAVYLASHFFNVSTSIEKVLISGFTQRRNKDGELNDDYIYSIIFTRPEFEHQELALKNPIEFCMSFDNRCNMSKTNTFKSIKPFDTAHMHKGTDE